MPRHQQSNLPRVRLLPYAIGSISAKALSTELAILRLKYITRFNLVPSDTIINWGRSTMPSHWPRYTMSIINHPNNVAIACNKLDTFLLLGLNGIQIPEWTTDIHQAQTWVDEGHTIYGRKTLTGHSGQGIIIIKGGEEGYSPEIVGGEYPECPLYTKATKAKYEYRVHVMAGKAIDVVQKKKKENFDGGTNGIRNRSNGWVYAHNNINVPSLVVEQAIKAVQVLGLDFGAVDIGYKERDNISFVYEVNTAPGLVGTTLQKYVQGIKENYLERS
jgi:glutathione synthase/RimK-type ligase-like ATP-grasp enzyme